jgi:hypothetical protein
MYHKATPKIKPLRPILIVSSNQTQHLQTVFSLRFKAKRLYVLCVMHATRLATIS